MLQAGTLIPKPVPKRVPKAVPKPVTDSERTAAKREKVCVVCEVAFTATRSHAKTCSDRCRQRLRRQGRSQNLG
jgi:predicted nucleic acid-binding Zn ribbon protein